MIWAHKTVLWGGNPTCNPNDAGWHFHKTSNGWSAESKRKQATKQSLPCEPEERGNLAFAQDCFVASILAITRYLFRLYPHRLIQTAIRVPPTVQGIPATFRRIRHAPGWIQSRRGAPQPCWTSWSGGPAAEASRSLPRRDAGHERGGKRWGLAAQGGPALNSTNSQKKRTGLVEDHCPQESAMAVKMDVSRGWGRFHYWGAMGFYISRYFFLTSSFSRSSSMLPS